MVQRENRHFIWAFGMHHPAAGATRRCPMQPSTPLGPDQANVCFGGVVKVVKVAEPPHEYDHCERAGGCP
jgi:hypothetical protein